MSTTTMDRRNARKEAMRPDENGELTHRQIVTILIGLMMGMFLAALDQTIVSTAIRTIADDLDGLSAQAWVTTAYLITSTIATPLYGKLSDIYGRKKFFIAAITIFVIGSALCSFATSMYMLAGFRAFQGIGAGGLFSLALAIIGDIVPPRERAKYQGYFLAVFGTSSVLGPVIGGFFAGQDSILGITGWRWVFLVNVPIGIAALFVVSATLHLHTVRKDHSIDWWGAATLIVALVPLLTVLEQGQDWGWNSGKSLGCFGVAAVGVIAFILSERAAGEEALIPLRIFKVRTISLTVIGSLIIGAGMFGGMMVVPLYLQIVQGATPTKSGFMMLPLVLGIMISSVVSGQIISRTGRIREFPIIGAVLIVIGFLLLWRIGADTPLWQVMAYMFVFGLGLGNTMQPLTLIVQNAVAPTEIGMATAAATFFRQMGATIGVAVFVTILFNVLPDKMSDAVRSSLSNPSFTALFKDPSVTGNSANQGVIAALTGQNSSFLDNLKNDTSVLTTIDSRLAYPFQVGFSDAMDRVFLIGACVSAVGLLVLLLMPKVTLRTASAASMARETEGGQGNVMGSDAGESVDAASDDGSPLHTGRRAGAPAGYVGAGRHEQPANEESSDEQWSDEEASDKEASDEQVAPREPYAVWGRVSTSGGQPVGAARLTLADLQGLQVDKTVADARGRYELHASGAGSFLVIATAEGLAPLARLVTATREPVTFDLSLGGRSGLSGRLIRDEYSYAGAPQRLDGAPLASERAADGSRAGIPLDGSERAAGDGSPLTRSATPSVRVTLLDSDGQVVATQQTVDGAYAFTGIRGGHYVLTVVVGTRRPQAQYVEVPEGEEVVQDITLSAGGNVAGRVVDAGDEEPVRGAVVTLVDDHGHVVASVTTGKDGSYWFEGVESGGYTLTASGYAPVAQHVTAADNGVTSVVVRLGGEAIGGAVAERRDPLGEQSLADDAGAGLPSA